MYLKVAALGQMLRGQRSYLVGACESAQVCIVMCSAFTSRVRQAAFRRPVLVPMKSIFREAYGSLYVFVK